MLTIMTEKNRWRLMKKIALLLSYRAKTNQENKFKVRRICFFLLSKEI